MGVRTNAQGISIAPLKSALQYADSDLGIDVETSSYGEICSALSEYFAESMDLYNAGVFSDKVTFHNPNSSCTWGTKTRRAYTVNANTLSASVDNINSVTWGFEFVGVNLAHYKTLYCIANGSQYSIDISTLTSDYGYVAVIGHMAGSNAIPMYMAATNSTFSNMDSVSSANKVLLSSGGPRTVSISRIWLER